MMTKSNGTLWAWGSDNYEQLGNGIAENYGMPTQIGTDSNWSDATAGYRQGNAIKLNNTFWVWGNTALVGTGSGNTNIPTQHSCQPLSLSVHDISKITVYPNPASETLYFINTNATAVNVCDINGRRYDAPFNHINQSLDVSSLAGCILSRCRKRRSCFNSKIHQEVNFNAKVRTFWVNDSIGILL